MSTSYGSQLLAQAIAQNEGWYANTGSNPNIPQQNNNPGDLTDAQGNIISFSNISSGWQALEQKLTNIQQGLSSVYSPNETLGQFASTYTGGNSTAAQNIAQSIGGGTTPSTSLSSIFGMTGGDSSTTGILSGIAGGLPGVSTASNIAVRIVAVVAGLVLVAGAVFGFDKVTETTVNIAKKSAEIAAA